MLVIVLALLAFSCSFNGVFLQPTKAPATAEKIRIATESDTTIVFFSGEHHQPTFTRNGKDTLDMGFTVEAVTFKSASGNKLNGWLLKPMHRNTETTILHLHGNAGMLLSQYQVISPLVRYGFQVFMFDYSGFGFSEGEATRDNVILDAFSALDYVKSRPDIQHTPLVLYGQSLGGHLASVVATERQDDLEALVIEGAFSSHCDIASHSIPVLGRIAVKEGYCAKDCIGNFQKPLLVIHSSEDDVIPFSMGKKLFETTGSSRKEFYEIKKPHLWGPIEYHEEISGKIKALVGSDN